MTEGRNSRTFGTRRTVAFALAVASGTGLIATLALAACLDAASPDYNASILRMEITPDGAERQRYVQFTGRPGELLFGYRSQPATPGIEPEPLRILLMPISSLERQARADHAQTAEGKNTPRFVFGFSRQQNAAKNFVGDYVTVRFWVIYLMPGGLLAGAVAVAMRAARA